MVACSPRIAAVFRAKVVRSNIAVAGGGHKHAAPLFKLSRVRSWSASRPTPLEKAPSSLFNKAVEIDCQIGADGFVKSGPRPVESTILLVSIR